MPLNLSSCSLTVLFAFESINFVRSYSSIFLILPTSVAFSILTIFRVLILDKEYKNESIKDLRAKQPVLD